MSDEYPLGAVIHQARTKNDWSIREVCRKIEESKITGTTVSPAYFSQVETGGGLNTKGERAINTDKISMDFFWAVGVVLGVDPMTLFVLSRPNIPERYVDPKNRKHLFTE